AVLSAGRRCPNASLPGSRYCGLPQHQALGRFGTNQVTVLAALEQAEVATLANPDADEAEVGELVARAEAAFGVQASDGGEPTAQQGAEGEAAPEVPEPDEVPDLETAREEREQAEEELSEAEEEAAEQIEEADEKLGDSADREAEDRPDASVDGADGTEPQPAERTAPVGAESSEESEAAAEESAA